MRASSQWKAKVVADFEWKRSCCHRPGMARSLRDRADVDLGGDDFSVLMECFSLATTGSIADAERQHAQNKNFNSTSGGGVGFH
eukprot:9230919-Pyramimonas_sp.AAC.1